MIKQTPILATLVVCSAIALVAQEKAKAPLQAMIDQERAFAKLADEKGTRDAFLEYLADESLLFTPGPTPGKLYYKNRPALPMKLRWAPEFADISAAGDLGYTSGPWELSRNATEPPSSFGHFNTLWRLQQDGSFRVEVDLGVPHDKPAVPVADVKSVESPKNNAPAPKETKPRRPHPRTSRRRLPAPGRQPRRRRTTTSGSTAVTKPAAGKSSSTSSTS
jgi:hypothetical protein